jgi:hypothetical protein
MNKLKLLDQIVLGQFQSVDVVDGDGKANHVPVVWGSDERVFNNNSMALPAINIYLSGYSPVENDGRIERSQFLANYMLNIHSLWYEDACQILEQIITKFTPTLLTSWPNSVPISLLSISNNLESNYSNFGIEIHRVIRYSLQLQVKCNLDDLVED